jgi:hypothetical protein
LPKSLVSPHGAAGAMLAWLKSTILDFEAGAGV